MTLPITPSIAASPTLTAAAADLRLTRAQVLVSRPTPDEGTRMNLLTIDLTLLADAIDAAYGWRTPGLERQLVVDPDGRIYGGSLYLGRITAGMVHLDRYGHAARTFPLGDVT